LATSFAVCLAANATAPLSKAQLVLDLGDQLIRAARHLVTVHDLMLVQDVGTCVGVAIGADIHLSNVQEQVVVLILTNKLDYIRIGVPGSRVPELVQLPLLWQKHQRRRHSQTHP